MTTSMKEISIVGRQSEMKKTPIEHDLIGRQPNGI